MKTELKTCRAHNGAEWRRWLEKHHDSSRGVWLMFYKKHTKTSSVTYGEALDEALCFGWIDSIVKRVDDECYLQKFTPRTNSKKWSTRNREHMRRLIAAGKVTESGLRVLGVPLDSMQAEASEASSPRAELAAPDCMLKAIARNAKADEFWQRLAPGFKRRYMGWALSAKREETRLRRIDEVVGFLVEGKKSVLK